MPASETLVFLHIIYSIEQGKEFVNRYTLIWGRIYRRS